MEIPTPEEDATFHHHYTKASEHLAKAEFHPAFEHALQACLRRPKNEAAYEILGSAVSGAYRARDHSLWIRSRPITTAHSEFISSVLAEKPLDELPATSEHDVRPGEEDAFIEWSKRWRAAWVQFRSRHSNASA
jgi:hypothetical protein